MTEKEIIKYIDDGANFYISIFGNAEHMEMVDCNFYRYVKPKSDEHGISFIYDVRLNDLSKEHQMEVVSEIKTLRMPIWLDLSSSDELFSLFFGKNKVHGQTVFDENDEVYMALLPTEKPNYQTRCDKIVRVQTSDEFATWAEINNSILAGGLPDMHPIFHYPLCQNGLMKCYIAYNGDKPVAVSSILDNNGIASLEFVATIPEFRRNGYAKAVCEKAIDDAFADGAMIVTARAINFVASRLYDSIGFRAYNYAL